MGRFTISPQASSTPGRFSTGRFYVPPEEDEDKFQRWYFAQAKRWGLDPNPDAPEHKYDYRAAFKAGQGPDPKTGHWPSAFKADDHPNRFVGIIDTKTGKPAPAWARDEATKGNRLPSAATPLPDPLEGQHPLKVFGEGVLDQVEQGATSLARLPDVVNAFLKEKSGGTRQPLSVLPEVARETLASSDEEVERGLQARLESQAARGRSPGSMLANEVGITAASFVADPLNIPVGASAKALGLLGRRGAGAVDEAAEVLARNVPPAAEPRAPVAPREVLQDAPRPPASEPPVLPPAVQADRRSNLGFRQEVDDALNQKLSALMRDGPEPAP